MCGRQAELFKVLGVGSRIRIIELLKQKGPRCVNEISDVLGISASAVSQHLKVLKYAGLVRNERKGYWIPYQLDPEALEKCRVLLDGVCSCSCEVVVRKPGDKFVKIGDDLELLKKYRQELSQELQKVQARIEKMEDKE